MTTNPLVFIWLDKRLGSLPGGNDRMKEKFRQLFSPLKQFDKPTSCEDHIEQNLKEKKIFFLTSASFADETLLKKIAALPQVVHLYLFDPTNATNLTKICSVDPLKTKMGVERHIQFDETLYEQLLLDLIRFHSDVAVQHEKQRNAGPAKESLQTALKFFELIDEKDQQTNELEANLRERLQKLK